MREKTQSVGSLQRSPSGPDDVTESDRLDVIAQNPPVSRAGRLRHIQADLERPPETTTRIVMIPKIYSEGICVHHEGPTLVRKFGSTSTLGGSRSYRTSVSFVKKMVPEHFVTTVRVDDDTTYYECIEFRRRTTMADFSETVNVFPKETTTQYLSTVLYDPDHRRQRFTAGLELLPVQKVEITSSGVFHVNGIPEAVLT